MPPMKANQRILFLLAAAVAGGALDVLPAAEQAPVGYTDTPMLPGGQWHVHDPDRPQPKVVTPGTFSAPETPGKPPSDAIVLFDGKDLSKWRKADGNPAPWNVQDGVIVCKPRSGDIFTRDEFGDIQLHLEFATPAPPRGESQERGNSGVFLFGKYELQILDSYQNRTYADGRYATIYSQYPPLYNASLPPCVCPTYASVFIGTRLS